MGNDWEVSTLGELAEIIMGQSPKGSDCNSEGRGVPLLNGPTEFGSHHPHPTQFTTDPKRFSKTDDLLFCVRGSTTGRMNWSDKEYAIGRGLAAFRHKKGKGFKSFLKAVIDVKIPELLASATGSTFPNVSKNQLNDLKVFVPPLPEQKAIAHILGSLDDKIELNRQMNETLEAMAQALFKSWFVDFDPVIDNALAAGNPIPDEFFARAKQRQALPKSDSNTQSIRALFPNAFEFTEEMGWIPEGWEVSNIGTEFNTVGGGTPSTKNPAFWEDGSINWTTPKDLSGNQTKILLDTDRKITDLGLKKISSGLLPVNTVLMSSRAPVGYLALAKVPVAINQGYIALKCEKTLTPEFAIQWADSIMDEIKQRAGGTTFAEISKTNFRGIPVFVPNKIIVDSYSENVKDLYNQVTSRIENINTLAKLRDTLLPKLMSGELRIADAAAMIEEV